MHFEAATHIPDPPFHASEFVVMSSTGKSTLWLRIGRAPNSTEIQKELERPKSGSKVTRADRPQSDLKLTQK